ncbi:MAG TPA: 30S ribosomal protein S20 [Chloroflexota bacterium]|nr:30S ribosomal protein S20 [Chloroflexota bacterium]
MANTKSAIKMIRVALRRHNRNIPIRSELKTLVKAARADIDAGQIEVAQGDVRKAASALDKAANKGTIHRNAAARRKSRLMKRLAKAEKATAAS